MNGVIELNEWRAQRGGVRRSTRQCSLKTGNHSSPIDQDIRNLAAAIFFQVIRDVLKIGTDLPENQIFYWQSNAWNWFFSDQMDPESFFWISETIGVDVGKTREWLLHYCSSNQDRKQQIEKNVRKIYASHLSL